MKFFLSILFVLFFGCGKEINKPVQNLPPAVKDTITEKIKALSGYSNDSLKENNFTPGYVKYGINKVPSGVKYTGSIVAMAQWKDNLGENVLLITETNENSLEDTRSKELFGYHYIIHDTGNVLLWKLNDFVKECPVDLTLDYIDKSLSITDLDKNGIGESSFIYKMSCKGDVSPNDMKLIMHEGDSKYAIRGSMDLVMNKKEFQKGNMEVDKSFDKAPAELLEFAKVRWDKFKTENIGN